jgi:site-specific recombinase XerD
MREDRNLAAETIKTKRFHVGTLLRWHDSRGGKAQELGLADVDAFQAESEMKHWSRRTMASAADSLRNFFRYGASRGWWCPSVAEGIEGPMVYREETLPAGPSWDDVGRLLSSLKPNDPMDIRDRAMILLLSVYGFRVGEVQRLSLEDIQWEPKELLVCRSKSGARQRYPLVGFVAEALWKYLQVRPSCSLSTLFVTLRAPFNPVSRFIIYNRVANRLAALGVRLNHRGPHSLRHACAARLVSQGLSLKEIGDHLGHRSAASTRIYAKVDLPNLREVAAFDLGGLA